MKIFGSILGESIGALNQLSKEGIFQKEVTLSAQNYCRNQQSAAIFSN